MSTKRTKALWAVAALLVVNAVLLLAQPGLALPGDLPRSLGDYFFGPKLVRAEVLVKEGRVLSVYRVDRGIIRGKQDGALLLRERDGTNVTIAIAPGATITRNGKPSSFGSLRKGMTATVIRDGDAPATEVRVGGK